MTRRFISLTAILVFGGPSETDASERDRARASAPVIIVRVVDDASRQPLPNAEVIDVASGVRRFTNGDGEARLMWPDAGRLRLRVRQLGFQFVERDLTRSSTDGLSPDTVTIPLARVAYVLPDVTTRVSTQCQTSDDATEKALAVLALTQLRMGAERYDAFRKEYPFRIRQQRRTIRFRPPGVAREVRESVEEETSADWGEPYQPGKVIDRRANGFSVPLLFLTALANPVFWDNHCFAVRGVQTLHDDRVLRLEFSPPVGLLEVDWIGTAFIDSATSVLRRVEFQLAGLRDDDVPRRLEGYTTFRSPSPFIVIPDSTVAMWWRRDPNAVDGEWKGPDVVQLIRLLDVRYGKSAPPR